jgi:prepilin-type N-terminal cleavage/methylation domain-containing protein
MKRRGFTLIELMVVIAIIIILAAIAIPNYLKMTERAKKSRVAADFGALALALESYKTDWGTYPVTTGTFGAVADKLLVSAGTGSAFGVEIAGKNATTAASTTLPNYTAHITATGEAGPIEYMKAGTIVSMTNPFDSTFDYHYIGETNDWGLFAATTSAADGAAGKYLGRTSTITTLVSRSTVPGTVSAVGTAD